MLWNKLKGLNPQITSNQQGEKIKRLLYSQFLLLSANGTTANKRSLTHTGV